jgi:NAD(P)-dependent dehydrogenase (short-subunit alcohol dehydrogenase family)
MADNRPLHEYLGDPIVVLAFADHSSDGTEASDGAAGVPILGASGIEFQLATGAAGDTLAQTVTIEYSSTGVSTDVVTSNAGMTCSDAEWAELTSDDANAVFILNFDLSAKGLEAAAGKLFVAVGAGLSGTSVFGVIARPYGGTRRYPATNASTVITADDPAP